MLLVAPMRDSKSLRKARDLEHTRCVCVCVCLCLCVCVSVCVCVSLCVSLVNVLCKCQR